MSNERLHIIYATTLVDPNYFQHEKHEYNFKKIIESLEKYLRPVLDWFHDSST